MPATPVPQPTAPALELLAGEGLGNGIPRGVLRLLPQAGASAGDVEAAATAGTGEVLVVGGAVVAAAGSVALVCVTVQAAAEGRETPIEVADRYYGTHFGDAWGWFQQFYSSYAPHVFQLDLFVRSGPQGVVSVGTGTSEPQPPSEPLPAAKTRQRAPERKVGRIYVTYTKFNIKTQRYYTGRTSMLIDPQRDLDIQARLAVAFRNLNHHVDESDEPEDPAFEGAVADQFDIGEAVDYKMRYDDPAYWRVRGREQQLMDFHGGAQSDTGRPYRTENKVRGVARDNRLGRRFHQAATERWGEIHPYTGN